MPSCFLLLVALLGRTQASTTAPPRQRVSSASATTVDSRVCSLRGGKSVEHTYAMLKPDVAGSEDTVAAIKAQIEESGLTIEREEKTKLSRRECEAFYAEHAERSFFGELTEFMCSGPVVKLELSGTNAIARWRELIGPTNSNAARENAPGSIRARFGTDNQRNAAHGSDSQESAARELMMMFK
mmetsp:Transcript_13223/g.33899  ORF Transcript_13223/g.33899 Transcript_13223/m.33899 type:complete len:184 (+) Transcript_13223:12-563(+)